MEAVMMDEMIRIDTDRKLRIFMHPLRQKILWQMDVAGKPLTAKGLADCLSITPSSAKHHLLALREIGVVRIHHTEQIHGITATYYERTPQTVSIGLSEDSFKNDKEVLLRNTASSICENYIQTVCRSRIVPQDAEAVDNGDFMSSVVHLTVDEVRQLSKLLLDFMREHRTPREGTHPYDFLLVGYRTDLE
jgi:DNA-binding transcriptional ArsR family regulator